MAAVLWNLHQYPSWHRVPEMMAYQATIVCTGQDNAGLAWVRCHSAFRRQAGVTGLTRWSAISPTIYMLSFAGSVNMALFCDHSHGDVMCATGEPDPGVQEGLKAIEMWF